MNFNVVVASPPTLTNHSAALLCPRVLFWQRFDIDARVISTLTFFFFRLRLLNIFIFSGNSIADNSATLLF